MLLIHSCNPLNPLKDHTPYQVQSGLSPNQMIDQCGIKPRRPVIFVRDGKCIPRRYWDMPIGDATLCAAVEIPGEAALIAFMIGLMIALSAIAYFYGMSLAQDTADAGTPSSLYSFSTGRNRLRIGEPFSESFGRGKIYPDLIQQSYIQNVNNDQYLYFIGAIGVGYFDVSGVYIDNTPLTDYADSAYNIVLPGETPTLVPTLVWTSNEVSSQELTNDWIYYVISAPGTAGNYIEYDITFSGGLVKFNSKGSLRVYSVTIQTQVCLVDSRGDEISSWVTLENKVFSGQSKDPIRWSRKLPAPLGEGRYKIKIRRVGDHSTSSKVMDKATFSGLRMYGAVHPDYSNVANLPLTLLEAKIKASDQLKGDAGSQINVIATRILSHLGPEGFGPCVAPSRNIADAIAYMATSYNGGRQPDKNIDFAGLYALRNRWETFDHFFDYRFTSVTTVMDAAALACRCGMAIPYLPGGIFSAVRDEIQEAAVSVFSADNLQELTISTKHRTADSPTCLVVKYIDPDTWEEETVTCIDDDGSENNPLDMTLDGCTSRQQAYEIGMQYYWQDRRERTQVEFTTGLIGFLPGLLSKIIVQNPMIKWGQSGLVAAVDGAYIWLSEPVDFDGEESGAIYVSLPNGSSGGPYTVLPTSLAHKVEGTIPDLLTIQDDNIKATRYLFGPASIEPMAVRVMSITPQARDKVAISGIVIDDSVYDDPGDAPEIGSIVGIPALLVGMSLTSTDTHEFLVSWSGSALKVKIEMDPGTGYTTLMDNYVYHHLAFSTTQDNITIKVTPYDGVTLETASALTDSYTFLTAPTGLSVTALADGVTVSWDAYTGADGYSVALYDETGAEVIDGTADAGTETVNFSLAELSAAGGPWTLFVVYVSALVGAGISTAANDTIEVDPLDAPATVDLQERFVSGISISWDAVAEAVEYIVCHDDSSGSFTPAAGNIVYRGAQPTAIIGGLDMTGSYTHYFKVAALNGYDDTIGSLNFSGALEVTPAASDVSVHAVSLASGADDDYTGPSGGSSYTYQLVGTASGDDETVVATLTGGGSGSAYCAGDGLGGDTTAALSAYSTGSTNVCNVAITGGGAFSGSLIITKIS